jgi:hypothetical protein
LPVYVGEDSAIAWIKTIAPEAAAGKLKEIYDAAAAPAGYMPQMTRLQSLRPETMEIGFALYRQLMDAPTGITRRHAC